MSGLCHIQRPSIPGSVLNIFLLSLSHYQEALASISMRDNDPCVPGGSFWKSSC